MPQTQHKLRAIGLLGLLAFPAIALNGAELDSFDALDAQLEAQFDDTDATLEENFQALDAALEAGFQRMAQEVEAVWGTDEVVLPDQNTWVDYSKNKRLRRSFDFERGVLVVETLVDAAGDMAQASTDIQQAVLTAQSDTAQDLADNDLALAYAEAYLAAEGFSLEAADNADPAPILGELLQVSDQDLAGLSSAIQSAELVLEPKSPAAAEAQSVTQRLDLPTVKIEVTSVPSREDTEAAPAITADPTQSDTIVIAAPAVEIAKAVQNEPADVINPVMTETEQSEANSASAVADSVEQGAILADAQDVGQTAPIANEGAPDVVDTLNKPIPQSTAPAGIVTTLTPAANNQRKVTVTIPLRADYLSERAKRYDQAVLDEADRRGLPASLIYAIMETESHFNPRARSHVPAFGLMQLVPKSGGVDAYNYVYGEKKILAPEYFFQPDQNVELGTAYLDLLFRRYLRSITDEQSRLYCTIAAYNTGAGNVAKAFTGKASVGAAASLINALSAEEVYEHLIENLPYDETRNYLRKVRAAQAKYKQLDVVGA
ncbi:murein transglycosylase domain-containing protein [Pseudomonadales bacterium]|nr:murein transglycosylase domain-containing protein [Pseudomonadales bacterium]